VKERGSYLSAAERDRRYSALRAIAIMHDCEAVVVVGPAQIGGKRYFRYFTDWNLQSFGGYLLIPQQGAARIVLKAWSQAFWSRLVEWISDIRSDADPASRVVEWLEPYLGRRIGFVGYDFLSVRDHRLISDALGPRLVDLTHEVDVLMGVRSDEELALIRDTARIFDEAWLSVLGQAGPGMTEWELAAIAGGELIRHGVSHSIILIGASNAEFQASCVGWPRDRTIGADDLVQMSIEGPGPNGYCVEIGGTFSFRPVSAEVQAQLDSERAGLEAGVAQLIEGRHSSDVAQAVEDVFAAAGLMTGYRGMHGIGLGIPELPTIDLGDESRLAAGNVIAMHPNAVSPEGRGALLSRTFIVGTKAPIALSQIELSYPVL
jgi:Xaa-Pro aminopeptidase